MPKPELLLFMYEQKSKRANVVVQRWGGDSSFRSRPAAQHRPDAVPPGSQPRAHEP
jgi:hypothetical protein